MRRIILIAHNLRSSHNVGSLLRTAEGLGVEKVYLTGYTPYPRQSNDKRLPHLVHKIDKQISKTALGAELSIAHQYLTDVDGLISDLKLQDYTVCALEQASTAKKLNKYQPADKVALVVGREVEGLEIEILSKSDVILEIPMFGKKESYNVAQATAMALYHLRFT